MSEAIDTPYIHFHIPKTAGTSLRATFANEYTPGRVAFRLYDGRLVRMSDMPFTNVARLDRIRRTARSIGMLNAYSAVLGKINRNTITQHFALSEITSQKIAVATGHFMPEDITDAVSTVPRTTVVRDPLDRMRSHYAHWREAKGDMWWHNGEVPYADDVSFETFATDPALANYQMRYLGNLSFAAVGTTADLPGFFRSIGIDQASVPTLNPGRHRPQPQLDPGFMREFTELHAADYELYASALQHNRLPEA